LIRYVPSSALTADATVALEPTRMTVIWAAIGRGEHGGSRTTGQPPSTVVRPVIPEAAGGGLLDGAGLTPALPVSLGWMVGRGAEDAGPGDGPGPAQPPASAAASRTLMIGARDHLPMVLGRYDDRSGSGRLPVWSSSR
jgi:hypothetical protein